MGVFENLDGAQNAEIVWKTGGFKNVGFRCIQRIASANNVRSDWLKWTRFDEPALPNLQDLKSSPLRRGIN